MNNVIEIDGHKAVVKFDPEISMFRGEFLGLSGGADFYADSVEGLRREGAVSLREYLKACAEEGIEPLRNYSGKFNVRIATELHEKATLAAAAENKSLNEWVSDALADALET